MFRKISDFIRHFFHVVSNVRPIVWLCSYVGLIPVFALIYLWLPEGQFRMPTGAPDDYGAWLYYSIVTMTTLGFGDYTPAMPAAQAITAVEVMCGLVILGLFLNAVGSMKSEIDVESEIEKQKRAHDAIQKQKLVMSVPSVLNSIDMFLKAAAKYKSGPDRRSFREMMTWASRTSLSLDSLQQRIDLSLWPRILENCFDFVATYQMFASGEMPGDMPGEVAGEPSGDREVATREEEMKAFIPKATEAADNLVEALTSIPETATMQN